MADDTDRRFLERGSYGRRRWQDAARLFPWVGFILLFLPVLLKTTNDALIYIFSIWALLIFAMAVVSRRLMASETTDDRAADPDPSGEV